MSQELTRLKPAFRTVGIEISSVRDSGEKRTRIFTIVREDLKGIAHIARTARKTSKRMTIRIKKERHTASNRKTIRIKRERRKE